MIKAYGYMVCQNVIEFHLERPGKVVSVHAMWTIADIEEIEAPPSTTSNASLPAKEVSS